MKHEITKKTVMIELTDGTEIGNRIIQCTKFGNSYFMERGKRYDVVPADNRVGNYIVIMETSLPGYELIEKPTT